MKPVNAYGRQLTDTEISMGLHRQLVGGMWDEIGRLQFDFLLANNLKPGSKFLDVGCGALRGGIHFIRYLDKGNYHGIDINESLIRAGIREIEQSGLVDKRAKLEVNDQFDFGIFRTEFDYALALSVFTHLPKSSIDRCLCELKKVLRRNGVFYATFFEAPTPAHLDPLIHNPGGKTTNYDADPYHYSFSEFQALSALAGLDIDLVGDWGHPRNQRMLAFSH